MKNPTQTRKILVVEDEHALASAIGIACQLVGAEAVLAPSGARALELLRGGAAFRLVVLDIGLPDMSGLEVLRRAFPGADSLPVPVVIITAHGSLEAAIGARKLGVAEYLLKPLDLHAFRDLLTRLLKSDAPRPAEAEEKETTARETTMIGAAPPMQQVFRDIAHACTATAPVVICGATGTGKTLAARLIHANCEPAPESLTWIDCETADSLADPPPRTMLVLENVDRLPPTAQAKLLALIESPPAGLRIVTTTRDALRDAVNEGRFRADLYYRLHVLEIRLPALRDRAQDIPAIAAYFLGRSENDRALTISPEAARAMTRHDWPGNVLELRSAIEYATAICGGSSILPQHLPASVTLPPATAAIDASKLAGALHDWLDDRLNEGADYAEILAEIERLLLLDLLPRFDHKPTRLAESLRMNRTTLRRKCSQVLGSESP